MVTWQKQQFMGERDGVLATYYEGTCLSTDEKPTGEEIYNGSCLMEIDTCTLYVYDDEHDEWLEWGA
jgi:hypothetical protein